MKVLEVSSLENGMDTITAALTEKRASLKSIEKTIHGLVSLEADFKGKGAEAVKGFYRDLHQPFLVKVQQVLDTYESKLKETGNALDSFEPSDSGFIRQQFLQNDLTQALTKAGSTATEITSESNAVIQSVQDIVALPELDDSGVTQNVKLSKESIDETVEGLEQFDQQQSTSLKELLVDLQLLNTYIQDMNGRLSTGALSIGGYSDTQLTNFMSRFFLVSSIQPGGAKLDAGLSNDYGTPQEKTKAMHQLLGLQGFPISTANVSKTPAEKKDDDPYLGPGAVTGDKSFETSAGLGKWENDWQANKDQIGGKSSFSGIHAGIKSDTSIIDSEFGMDIAKAEAKAQIGGDSIFPGASVEGTILNGGAKAQLDDKIPVIGRSGAEANGKVLTASASAGVDAGSAGISAKAALAEGEVSGIFGVPWTRLNIKGTIGGSAGSVGGEIKVGQETVVDLRALLGVKIGIKFEWQK
ncbi:T7SS effector LXG polymorphic toxin [Peribacillus sp. SCS-26]|uniref:T7SS effector LXG polymorphic toxin n=1 Tax=Paraperibacillus marinus TaxID=3115295 RepID=UPI0039066436